LVWDAKIHPAQKRAGQCEVPAASVRDQTLVDPHAPSGLALFRWTVVTMGASLSYWCGTPPKRLIVSQRLQSNSAARDVEQPVQSIQLDSKLELLDDVLDRHRRPISTPLALAHCAKQGLVVAALEKRAFRSASLAFPNLRAREARPRRHVCVRQRTRRTRMPQPQALPPLQS
jgi:hypothetical protein